MDEHTTILRNAIDSLQSDETLFVTHSARMLWKDPNQWMRYNTMNGYPPTITSSQIGSVNTYHATKQKYMAI